MAKIITNIMDARDRGTINVYAVRYNLRNINENIAIALPGNINHDLRRDFCENIITFKDRKEVVFNPISDGLENETYEYVPLKNVEDKWNEISALIHNSLDYQGKENRKKVPSSNLYICILNYSGHDYYLCSKQRTKSENLLRGKVLLTSHQDELMIASSNETFIMSSYVGFIVDTSENKILIFDKNAFQDIFKYDDFQKKKVQREIYKIDSWKFLSSGDFIKERCSQKNVYQGLTRIFEDEEYMKQISQITPSELKYNLLNGSPDNFSEDDFDGDNLVVSSKNLEKVMKMLTKGFKFNFFTNSAEQL